MFPKHKERVKGFTKVKQYILSFFIAIGLRHTMFLDEESKSIYIIYYLKFNDGNSAVEFQKNLF